MYQQPIQSPSFGQGYQNPQYGPPPNMQYGTPQYNQPPPPQVAPTIVTIDNKNKDDLNKSFCPICTNDTPSYPKKVLGPGNFLWCLVGFAFVGPFSILAICMDNFNDTEMKCTRCMETKQVISNVCD